MTDKKTYIGDGAYAEVEHGMIKLTTSNGYEDTNTIYMEGPVLESFLRWVETIKSNSIQ
tara:strand:- start:1229 stop:1405 length:177 start_codon:yes stop_codon:yes gene_type:complete